ncbi:MAG TPA: hypothetical protein PK466_12595 [Thermotogota bacterium]|nr:hypothetical protein [Thermotogota bacterium]HPJ89956.1 hypothetical protein [Thermotogota bacterium]HPR97160.1 hypothetical protein [Thermotogota bacterium]
MKKGKKTMLGMTWMSYMGSVYGCLKQAGMWDDTLHNLIGQTGMGFHFIISDKLCASGPTVYNWTEEHFRMLDRVGIYSEQEMFYKSSAANTFKAAQKIGAQKIQASIDAGKPVIVWGPTPIPEFGIIWGYDTDDRVFFVEDCMPAEPDPLMYDNLGISDVPIFYLQFPVEKVSYDKLKTIRKSLVYAVDCWTSKVPVYPGYAIGKMAYDFLINGLQQDVIDEFGLSYSINVYDDLKENVRKYFDDIRKMADFDLINPIYDDYVRLTEIFHKAVQLVPFSSPGGEYNYPKENFRELVGLMTQAKELEDRIMTAISEKL